MLRRCAWCGTWLGQTAPVESMQITHGICPGCLELVQRELREALAIQSLPREEAHPQTAAASRCELIHQS